MNRTEFERLRDLQGKVIRGDITFQRRDATRPFLLAEIEIENEEGYELRLLMRFNPEVGSKTFAVDARGVGPICRLDIDGHNHPPAGRNHKHSLHNERCPDRNLPTAVSREELAGQSMRDCFTEFCRIAAIVHVGQFHAPDEGT